MPTCQWCKKEILPNETSVREINFDFHLDCLADYSDDVRKGAKKLATFFPPSAVADVEHKLRAPLFYDE